MGRRAHSCLLSRVIQRQTPFAGTSRVSGPALAAKRPLIRPAQQIPHHTTTHARRCPRNASSPADPRHNCAPYTSCLAPSRSAVTHCVAGSTTVPAGCVRPSPSIDMRHYRPLPAHRKLALDARTEGRYGLCRCALDGGGGGASARGDDELDEQHHPRGHLLGVEVELGVVAHSPKGHALDMPRRKPCRKLAHDGSIGTNYGPRVGDRQQRPLLLEGVCIERGSW
mmetsp:Transcript_52232/g.117335  ORF Transcript_52232/g.117335 Transcript_52232/m.117335 type:complete len:225 (-) Transcript_52232:411-1085(-)